MQTVLLRSRSLLSAVFRFKEMLEAFGEWKSEYFVLYKTENHSLQIAMRLSSVSSFCAYVTMIIGIKGREKENEFRIVLMPYLA